MSSINGKFNLNNINNKSVSNLQKIELVYLQEDDININFETQHKLQFTLYKKNGSSYFNNSFFKSPLKKQKLIFELHLYYQWLDADYPPRFNFQIIKNNDVYINIRLGINDTLETNYIYNQIIIDLNDNDKIEFFLKKDISDINISKFKIYDNSNYILKSF